MFERLFLKKTVQSLVDEAAVKRHTFTRSLTAFNLMTIGIGTIVGTGLFVITGQVAAEFAGPGVFFSFLIAGIISAFAALCYAEFAALIPIAGSAYSYAYVILGEFPAWILGWAMTAQYLLCPCSVAVGWSGYFTSLVEDFGIKIPIFLSSAPFVYDMQTGWHLSGSFLNLPAMLIVALMGILVSTGVKAATSVNNIMVILKFSVVLLFIACGIAFIKVENLTPFIPENTGVFGQYGFSGILRGAGLMFFAFIGFDVLSTLTQETKNPQKDMPKGMLGSLSICTLVYLIFSIVLTGVVSYKLLNVSDPIAVAVNVFGKNFLWLRFFVKIAILAGFTSVIMVMLMGQARILCTMAHDGLLPQKMGKIQERTHTPLFATAIISLVAMAIAGLFPVGALVQMVSMGTLMAFAIVCCGVLILRYKQPNLHRPFKTPLMPWVPILGTLACIAQMALLPSITWIQMGIWIALGCLVYCFYGIKRSKIQKQQSR
jgi:basic amino acid/polyamine antiporter, APA family